MGVKTSAAKEEGVAGEETSASEMVPPSRQTGKFRKTKFRKGSREMVLFPRRERRNLTKQNLEEVPRGARSEPCVFPQDALPLTPKKIFLFFTERETNHHP